MSNARIMEYVGEDFLSHPVYKCLETGVLYKDITLGSDNPQLYSCGNDFDGDPDTPIKSDLEIQLVGRESEPNQFDYMMLSRLQSDCDYYLGYGNRFAGHLYHKEEKEHISAMKKLWNKFPNGKKPEWLTYEDIANYENQMVA